MKNSKFICIILQISFLIILNSCINYIPCRGQEYTIENINYQQLSLKIDDYFKSNPNLEIKLEESNSQNPWKVDKIIYWNDLNIRVHFYIHKGNQNTNQSPTITFTHIGDKEFKSYKDINSKEISKELNQTYLKKFENDVLNKLGVNWKSNICF
ncbi:hypothetical protein [Faecalibacter macacae]|uniref:Uncharacterized protein n=1 Tax=Faecalibacter macacae TaxID=1859289 RepID=A0A3L9M1I7_9FLAO|nr:hypothetical protein [Faecalibacter macacae]RLZ06383.1 hypothetical protein EAH69_13750 [Faecalibacter macacae]